jgi:hypothetical protein
MVFCGLIVQELRGETYQSDTVVGQQLLAAFTDGATASVWQRIIEALQQQADARGQLDWKVHHVDSSVIRAHQHAAGAKGGEPEAEDCYPSELSCFCQRLE